MVTLVEARAVPGAAPAAVIAPGQTMSYSDLCATHTGILFCDQLRASVAAVGAPRPSSTR